ncbi:DUF4422 domain-containing protein [Heyndrickxia coagulans]|uniref:DUF4422 domain-containing protein n=1 Tax=Heyndrickxia coagulans TaxID=1398 RepID=A0A150KCG2_HEYCO|nr:DUF4422 domain-containing protein [Heyndrickxia coagulans]KYC67051.1 hypothetical protein B4099_1045 [Heyndrickxia coagulans]
MSKDIKILVATHKKYEMPNDDMYLPIHVGKEGKKDLGYQGDNTGDNISLKNKNYCEMTGIYWAWKNLDCDFIGLCHYRRYFKSSSKKEILNNEDNFSKIIDRQEVEELLNKYDIILPKRRNYYIETIWSHYEHAHNIKDLIETKKILNELYPEYINSFDKIMYGKHLHLYNMFVLSKNNFDSYCDWLFNILFELEERIDISNYNNYQGRVFGFISERLFNVWLLYNKLETKELDILFTEKEYLLKKYFNFIKRKFSITVSHNKKTQ